MSSWLNQAALTWAKNRHTRGAGDWLMLNRTCIKYAMKVTPEANSIEIAVVALLQLMSVGVGYVPPHGLLPGPPGLNRFEKPAGRNF